MAMRAYKASLPIFCLYRPMQFFIATSCGSFRMISHIDGMITGENITKNLFGLALSVCSLAALFFHFQLGNYFTSLSDLSNNLWELGGAFFEGKWSLALSHLLKSAHNCCYLSIMHTGALEIILASMLLSSLSSFYEAFLEGRKGRYLETGTGIFLAGFRLHGAFGQYQKMQEKKALEKIAKFAKIFERVARGRKISHLYEHPLQDLKKKLKEDGALLEGIDGELFSLGYHEHGFGKGLVKGMNLKFQERKSEDGKEVFQEMEFKINHAFHPKLEALLQELQSSSPKDIAKILSFSQSRIQGISLKEITLNFADHGKVGSAWEIDCTGLGKILIGKDPYLPTMYDRVTVTMKPGAKLYDFHELLAFFDLDSALERSMAEDIERMQLGLLFHVFSPKHATHFERDPLFFSLSVSELKKKIIEKDPSMGNIFSQYMGTFSSTEILPGRKRFTMDGLAKALEERGLYGFTAGLTGACSDLDYFSRCAKILKLGLMGSEMRYEYGINERGLSLSGDLYFGSSDSVFTQAVTKKISDFENLIYDSPIRFCFSSKLVERFPYMYNNCQSGNRTFGEFASRWLNLYEDRPNPFQFLNEETKRKPWELISSEVMFKERILPSEITKIVVDNEITKKRLINYLREKKIVQKDIQGRETILGIVAERFITTSRNVTKDLFTA